jgi:hypothetical protein
MKKKTEHPDITFEQARDFLDRISGGTTCSRFYEVYGTRRDYIIARHNSHFGHYNRMGGNSTTCGTAHRVYRYTTERVSSHDCMYPLFEITGRLSKEKLQQIHDFIDKE